MVECTSALRYSPATARVSHWHSAVSAESVLSSYRRVARPHSGCIPLIPFIPPLYITTTLLHLDRVKATGE